MALHIDNVKMKYLNGFNNSIEIIGENNFHNTMGHPILILIMIVSAKMLLDSGKKICLKTREMAVHGAIILITFVVTGLISPLAVASLGLFGIYRWLIDGYFKLKFDKSYGGLLTGGDYVWSVEDASRSIINALYLIDFKDHDAHWVAKQGIETCKKHIDNPEYVKLHSIRHREFGYVCMINNKMSPEEGVEIIEVNNGKEYISKMELEEILSDYCNKPMPQKDRAFWNVLVVNKPLKSEGNSKKNVYPVLGRFHHTIGDGPAIVYHILKQVDEVVARDCLRMPPPKPPATLENKIKSLLLNIYFLLLSFPFVVYELILQMDEPSLIFGKNLSGEKIIAFEIEDKPKLVKAIKKLKKESPGSAFGDFLLCALSASLVDYFEQKSAPAPQQMSVVIPIPVPEREIKLNNTFSIGLLNLPVNIKYYGGTKNNKLMHRLEKVMASTRDLRKSQSILINYWLLANLTPLLPIPVLQLLASSDNFSLAFSSLPGFQKISIAQAHPVEEMLFWVPNKGKTGVGISTFTYDDRLQISIIVDKVLIDTREDAHLILNGIFRYLNLLCDGST